MRIFLFSILLLLLLPVVAQQNYVLKLTNTRNPEKIKLFHNGDRVSLYYQDGNELEGFLTIVDKTTMVVDSQVVNIEQVPIIVNRKSAGFMGKTAGVLLAATGTGIAVVGFAYFFKGIGSGLPDALYLVPGGLLVSVVGVQVVSAGFRMIVGKGKKYYLGLDWSAEIVEQ